MEVKQTPVAAKVAGRIANIYIKEAMKLASVHALIDMDSPEINAKVEEAQSRERVSPKPTGQSQQWRKTARD